MKKEFTKVSDEIITRIKMIPHRNFLNDAVNHTMPLLIGTALQISKEEMEDLSNSYLRNLNKIMNKFGMSPEERVEVLNKISNTNGCPEKLEDAAVALADDITNADPELAEHQRNLYDEFAPKQN